MHDIFTIRSNPEHFDKKMARRGHPPVSDGVIALYRLRISSKARIEELLAENNKNSKKAGQAKAAGNTNEFHRICKLKEETKETIAAQKASLSELDKNIKSLLESFPNTLLDTVPDGKDEADNVVIDRFGVIREFDFEPKQHFDIPCVINSMDFETAASMSGSRFVLLSGAVARIHRALAQFMLDQHTEKRGMLEVNTPVIVNSSALEGTGQLPKFAEDCYQLANKQWLIPTSEVSLTNIVADSILKSDQLPMRLCAHTLCFRKEAGAAGRDTSGMVRQHQFEKVEMVSIVKPEQSVDELERMTLCAEAILHELKLPFRRVLLCSGETGFGSQRTNDIEVWLPGQGCYREISSVSLCGDFQARRMDARFRDPGGWKPRFVHTLNGSGVAIGRCLIAVLENGQNSDGTVSMPEVLIPYLGGKDRINEEGILV